MRHAAGRRRARAAIGEVLPDCDDLPALRHRSRVSLSVGDDDARAVVARTDSDRRLLFDPDRRLHLYLAQGCPQLGSGIRSRLQARTETRPRRGEEIPLWDSKLITKFPF